MPARPGDGATLAQAEPVLTDEISGHLEGVTVQQIYADYENGNLSKDQAIGAFELMGEPGMINAGEQRHRQELEQEAQASKEEGLEM